MSGFRIEDLSRDLSFKSEPYLIYCDRKNNGNSNYLLSSAKKMNLEKENFNKKDPITKWEKLNTLDC